MKEENTEIYKNSNNLNGKINTNNNKYKNINSDK